MCCLWKKLDYPDNPVSPDYSLIETKFILNSNIYDAKKWARLMSCDLKDLCLASPMDQEEYMQINMKHLPPDNIQWYNIHKKLARDGYVNIKIKK